MIIIIIIYLFQKLAYKAFAVIMAFGTMYVIANVFSPPPLLPLTSSLASSITFPLPMSF